jgi:hypothetical protein
VVGFVVGVVVGAVVVGAVVGEDVGLLVGEAVHVGDVVGVGVQVAEYVGLPVAECCVTGAFPLDWDAGVAVGFFAGVFEEPAVAVGVAGGFVVSPASDVVGLTLGAPCGRDTSRTATTAMMTAAATAVTGQRHRPSGDGRLPGGNGGMPPAPPGRPGPAALNGPDAGTRDVSGSSGPRLRSTRVPETESAAPDARTTGSSVVGS